MNSTQQKMFEKITAKVISNLSTAGKWSKPWGSLSDPTQPYNAISGRAYSGFNVFVLACANDYNSNAWLTYKQAISLGGNVMKGEKSQAITFYGKSIKKDKATGEVKSAFSYMKIYSVFNIEQCENLDTSKIKNFKPLPTVTGKALELAEQLQAKVAIGGNVACFIPAMDTIKMPHSEAFETQSHFDATLLHEITHWTGHSCRLARLTDKRASKREYAFEELVAELGSAMAGSVLGLPYEGLQHDSYIANWLKSLDGDIQYVYDAAVLAQKAVNHLIENSDILADEIAEHESEAA